MSALQFGVNDPLSNEAWSTQLYAEVIEETKLGQFIGAGTNSMITRKDELSKSAGSRVTCGLRSILVADGKQGNEVLRGDEEAITTVPDSLIIDELRHATEVSAGGTIEAQRVPYELRSEAYDAMRQWYAERIDESGFNQLCGFTPASANNTKRTGNQAVQAPSTNNILRPGGKTTDQALVANDTISLTQIDALIERAKTMRDRFAQPIIRPFMINGEAHYVMFVHDYQVTDLRRDAGDGGWLQLQRDALQGGAISGNGLFDGALGMYNRVILHSSTRVTRGVDSTNAATPVDEVRRAVFCGAQAAWMAWGQTYDENSFKWVEELTDYEKTLGVAVTSTWGMKKSQFGGADYGTIVLSTRAQPHDI
jgi:N4-gp56 family major capsid protein